jgi:hypothetical protein
MAGVMKKKSWEQIPDEKVIMAIELSNGILTKACKILKLNSYTSFRQRVMNKPELRKAFAEAKETGKDKAEEKLFEAVEKGEPWAIQFYLKALAKDRGFNSSMDINVNGDLALSQKYNLKILSEAELRQLEELTGKAITDETGN